jgi:hypothetical protein
VFRLGEAIGALNVTNNLSDLTSLGAARANLGLGSAAISSTGTSGATIPLLNGANTWSGVQSFNSGAFVLKGAMSGSTTINAAAARSGTLTLPAATDTLTANATTATLTIDVTPTQNRDLLSVNPGVWRWSIPGRV